jgi:hypothetical protein
MARRDGLRRLAEAAHVVGEKEPARSEKALDAFALVHERGSGP